MEYNLYEVGGAVRDSFLGIKSKDIDYAFEFKDPTSFDNVDVAYQTMNSILREQGFEIFLETPDCFTTRAKFPEGHQNEGLVADFVLCRKEVSYPEDSRRPKVVLGTLYDDLERRDFTCNAIARTLDGEIIDPFNGVQAIKDKILITPLSPEKSMGDDPLRMLRALRFKITHGFDIDMDLFNVILYNEDVWGKFEKVVSPERIMEELNRMFNKNTKATMFLLSVVDRYYLLFRKIKLKAYTCLN